MSDTKSNKLGTIVFAVKSKLLPNILINLQFYKIRQVTITKNRTSSHRQLRQTTTPYTSSNNSQVETEFLKVNYPPHLLTGKIPLLEVSFEDTVLAPVVSQISGNYLHGVV